VKKKSPPYAIIIAAILGLVAIFAAVKWKQNQDAVHAKEMADAQAKAAADLAAAQAAQAPVVQQTPTDMRPVYYATQPVAAGAKISAAFYEEKLTPNDILPDAYAHGSDIVGFYAIRSIEKGDPLTPRNIGRSLPQMSTRISPGMRAVSIPIFNAQANDTGGFAVDGDMVDLFYTATDRGALVNTQMIMQNLKILYIPGPKIESDQVNGVVPEPPPGDPVSITFEVTPEQAQALIFLAQGKAEQGGTFSMVLRAMSDKSEIKIKPFVGDDYYGNLQKIQKTVDKSDIRVQQLAAQIAAAEKAAKDKNPGPQGNTNETPNPTPPSP